MNSDTPPITQLLERVRGGEKEALDALIPLVYEQLHAVAENCFRHERPGHTLRATALVHEAYLRLAGADIDWRSRAHFFAVSARVMRRILVDHARAQHRVKRGGGGWKFSLDEVALVGDERSGLVVALDEAMIRLSELDPRKSDILEMIYFGGLTYEEAAEAKGVSVPTVQRDLRMAKAWIHRELSRMEPAETNGA